MNIYEAKRDASRRLRENGVRFSKLSGKTISFCDLARTSAIFVYAHDASELKEGAWFKTKRETPKPSNGGYILNHAT